jgi:excisionase family DNA binding protein
MSDVIRWLKVGEAADRARCGAKTIYRAVQSGQLRAARIGGRRELRFLGSWIDCWLVGEETEQPGSDLAAGRQIGPPLEAGAATRGRASWR